ncbi:diguanylate cyclase domain-containing protein [Actinoplanes sp. CA-142083]|uniref:GGDEF domain-containing protein n=1 Tax=Actinoplanes sp. CA-142083 TaxID=3239903 RepID=UPI003D8D5771
MQDPSRHAARLLERAQAGEADAVLTEVTAGLGAPGGDLACLHFVRVVALIVQGDLRAALAAVEIMLRAAEREGSNGWVACALATRASERLRLGEEDIAEYDVDSALRDLSAAEAALRGGFDPVAAVNARVGIAVGYLQLRLYELAGPQYEAAYAISAADAEQNGNRAMWLFNLAEMHLHWALELYQVGQVTEAEDHTADAERFALRAVAEASGSSADTWRELALLMAACARADRDDPAGASIDIEHHFAALRSRGVAPSMLAFSWSFRAVALKRSGKLDEAVRVIEEAIATLPADSGWLITAATHRTHAVLLAARGSAGATVGLSYGDTLAAALWRQRQHTLHTAATLKSLEALRAQHEQATRAADLDPLTGIANRRAFDRAVRRAQTLPTAPNATVTVLIIDTDKFKQINDTFGHPAGDTALRAIARALSAQLRDQDLIARLGGDEFGALLPDATPSTAAATAARMLAAVRALPDCPATVSIGIATAPAIALGDALLRADQAMYEAKRAGGDAIRSPHRETGRHLIHHETLVEPGHR